MKAFLQKHLLALACLSLANSASAEADLTQSCPSGTHAVQVTIAHQTEAIRQLQELIRLSHNKGKSRNGVGTGATTINKATLRALKSKLRQEQASLKIDTSVGPKSMCIANAPGGNPKSASSATTIRPARKPSSDSQTVFDFNSLMALANHANSIDQLIPNLPDDYKNNFVLMLQSGSIQSADSKNPRVISYGEYENLDSSENGNSDRLYIAFQTDPSTATANSLEVIEWVPKTKSYNFYQVDFPITPNSVNENPESCKECHGNPLRPNWSSYPRWDGVLGNNNGLSGSFDVDPLSTTTEQTKEFVANLSANQSRLAPFNFANIVQFPEYPPAYLSQKIASQLAPRDVEVLRNSPDFQSLKYAIAGAMMECANLQDFFSPPLLKKLLQGVFDNLKNVPPTKNDVTRASDLTFDKLVGMTAPQVERGGTHFGNLYPNEVEITAGLRLVLEGSNQYALFRNLLGNPLLKMSNDPSWTYDFVGFSERVTLFRDAFLDQVSQLYPATLDLSPRLVLSLNSPSTTQPDDSTVNGCQQLSKLSLKATANYSPQAGLLSGGTPLAPGSSAKVLFQNYCSACHAGGERALPLGHLTLLSSYITKAGPSKGKTLLQRLENKEMPPEGAPQPQPAELSQMTNALTDKSN